MYYTQCTEVHLHLVVWVDCRGLIDALRPLACPNDCLQDPFARVDGATSGKFGRVFKCALREAEGCYTGQKKLPSKDGLPPGKMTPAPASDDSDGGQDGPRKKAKKASIPNEECKVMLDQILAYAPTSTSFSAPFPYLSLSSMPRCTCYVV